MRLFGKNFQSWADFDIDISGLTVMTGESNIGKSALFRAVKGVFRNELPAECIRIGEDEVKVGVEIAGQTFIATRALKGSTKYVIDGELYKKLNQQVPDPIRKLGFSEMKVGDFELDPIFATQSEPQFLLDRRVYSPAALNSILGAFSSTEKLEAGKKEANGRISQRNSEARTLASEIGLAESRKAALLEVIAQFQVAHDGISVVEPRIRSLEASVATVRRAISQRQVLAPLKAILGKVDLPDITHLVQIQLMEEAATQAVNSLRLSRFYLRLRDSIDESITKWRREIMPDVERLHAVEEAIAHKARLNKLESARLSKLISTATSESNEATKLESSIRKVQSVLNCLEILKNSRELHKETQEQFEALQTEEKHIQAHQNLTTVTCPQCGANFEPLG